MRVFAESSAGFPLELKKHILGQLKEWISDNNSLIHHQIKYKGFIEAHVSIENSVYVKDPLDTEYRRDLQEHTYDINLHRTELIGYLVENGIQAFDLFGEVRKGLREPQFPVGGHTVKTYHLTVCFHQR